MAKMKKLEDLFHDTLKDVYFAEKKILTSLPKMAKAAQHADLKAAFEKHRGETEGQIDRLEQVFAEIDQKPQAKTCDAIVGITKEGQEIMDEYKGMPAHDAGLLAAAQAVEHYEMTRYGTLRTWAEELGYSKSVTLLQQTLDEERATDAALTNLAKAVINLDAEKDKAAEIKRNAAQRAAFRGGEGLARIFWLQQHTRSGEGIEYLPEKPDAIEQLPVEGLRYLWRSGNAHRA